VAHYREGAALGSTAAMMGLGWCYSNGLSLPLDDTRATACYRQAADLGDSRAQVILARRYCHGTGGLVADASSARDWFRVAAEAGNMDGQADYGRNLLLYGATGDVSKALEWLELAYSQGSVYAASIIACVLTRGTRGYLGRSDSRAVQLWRQAAAAGDRTSCCNLARGYQDGRWGLKANRALAEYYLRKGMAGYPCGPDRWRHITPVLPLPSFFFSFFFSFFCVLQHRVHNGFVVVVI